MKDKSAVLTVGDRSGVHGNGSDPQLRVNIHPTAKVSAGVAFRGRGSIDIGPFVNIEDSVVLDVGGSGAGRISIGSRSKLKHGTVFRCYNGTVTVGHRTTVGDYTVVYGHGGVAFGDHIGIGPHCVFAASQHIAYDLSVPIRYQGETVRGIAIEDDVWLGAGVQVLDGVKVGKGCVIGAGSVVTQTTPPDQICIGVPCKPIRDRSDWSPL